MVKPMKVKIDRDDFIQLLQIQETSLNGLQYLLSLIESKHGDVAGDYYQNLTYHIMQLTNTLHGLRGKYE